MSPGSKLVSNIPWLSPFQVLSLGSFPDFPHWGTVKWKYKTNKPFPPKLPLVTVFNCNNGEQYRAEAGTLISSHNTVHADHRFSVLSSLGFHTQVEQQCLAWSLYHFIDILYLVKYHFIFFFIMKGIYFCYNTGNWRSSHMPSGMCLPLSYTLGLSFQNIFLLDLWIFGFFFLLIN